MNEVTDVTSIKKPGVYKIKSSGKIVTFTGTDSRVQQDQAELTNVNRLLEPAMRKGLLRHTVKFAGQYDDIPVSDLQDAMLKVASAKSMYQELPMDIRKRFKTPAEFLAFVQDPTNANEMQKMGLLAGNDGLTATGAASGAPTKTDKDGDGNPDPVTPRS